MYSYTIKMEDYSNNGISNKYVHISLYNDN